MTVSDSNDQSLPLVDVRVALFNVDAGQVRVALTSGYDSRALPVASPRPGESLDDIARHVIRTQVGLQEQYLEQLFTFSVSSASNPYAVVVSYLALIGTGALAEPSPDVGWISIPVGEPVGSTDWQVIDYALLRLRAKLGYTNIAFYLLPTTFTLSDLQATYEAILGRLLDKRNFRRRITASGIVVDTQEKRREVSHRPATLYRFRSEHDPASYLTPSLRSELT